MLTGGDDDAEDGQAAEEGAGEIFLEPIAYRMPASFTDRVDLYELEPTATTEPVIPTLPAPEPEEDETTSTTVATVRSVQGSAPGLYGGTRDRGACDPEQLIAFLGENDDKAAAWAGVIGITVGAIPDYVRSLTPVVLQRDTRVTNHGFRNGRATTLASVLQAGTAVLVDDLGVPRVKCACGNPLTEPTPVAGPTSYTGQSWPSFAPANVVVVAPAPAPLVTIVLVDTGGGEPFTRPAGTGGTDDAVITTDSLCDLYPEVCAEVGHVAVDPDEPTLGTGDVQITLRWFSTADLDLSVVDPTGAAIDYDNPASPSGGRLDVDSNGGCGDDMTSSPVENIFWPEGTAPDGDYLITVDYFDVCPGGEGPQSFTLTFALGGVPVEIVPASTTGDVELLLTVHRGEVAAFHTATSVETTEGTLNPGESQTFRSSKGPGFDPEVPETTTTEPPEAPADGDEPGVEVDCSQYEEGTPMRILCEHDPTSNDVSDEGGGLSG